MGNKSSWRLKFIDIDSSFTIASGDEGAVKGYMVVRAPKGTKEAKLFTRGSGDAIRAYIGLENANWPDIQEAITFNNEYDLYISCPPGSSSEYPSYIDGAYITKSGIKKFYNVSSKSSVDFTEKKVFDSQNIKIIPNYAGFDETSWGLKSTESSFAIELTISDGDFSQLKEIGLNYWGDDNCPEGIYYYKVVKNGDYGYLYPEIEEDGEFFALDGSGDYDAIQAGVYYKEGNEYKLILTSGDWIGSIISAKNMAFQGTAFHYGNYTKDSPYKFPFFSLSEFFQGTSTLLSSAKGIYVTQTNTPTQSSTPSNEGGTEQGTNGDDNQDPANQNTGDTPTGDDQQGTSGTSEETTPTFTFGSSSTENSEKLSKIFYYEILRALTNDSSYIPDNNTATTAAAMKVYFADGNNTLTATLEGETTKTLAMSNFFSLSQSSVTDKYLIPTQYSITTTIDDASSTNAYSIVKSNITIGVGEQFTALLDIQSQVYGYVLQKSPTEKPTVIKFEDIGYDKYIYDDYVVAIQVPNENTLPSADKVGEIKGMNNLILLYTVTSTGPNDLTINFLNEGLYLFDVDAYTEAQKNAGANATVPLTACCTKVQKKKIGQRYLITKNYKYNTENVASPSLSENNETKTYLDNHIVYVESKNKILIQTVENKNSNGQLQEDIGFNTITFSCSEEVWPGEKTSGGTFTGSLSETGKDSYGSNIFFPNVLNEEDFSFIDFVPVKTFDEDLDDTGIFTKTRIIDDILEEDMEGHSLSKTYSLTLKGQRTVTGAVNKNIKAGVLGGTWCDDFDTVVNAGWTEAMSAEYDDVYIFIDPTGRESIHSKMPSVLNIHKLAIAISPKLLSKMDFNNIDQVVTTVRNERMALYAGEFKVYDSYSGKYYWCTPIGDVALSLARIFEFKLGGWAPAWFNYGGVGGQLSRNVLSAKWKFSDNDTEVLDKKGINPIIYNTDDGLMVVSQKTLQDPNNLTDWGYLGHVMSFVLCKREIRDLVMRPQLLKPIDDYWYEVRQTQLDSILARRLSGSTKIWTAAIGEVASVNNDKTKAQRKFCLRVRVKVTPFSEWVELEFNNVDQQTIL